MKVNMIVIRSFFENLKLNCHLYGNIERDRLVGRPFLLSEEELTPLSCDRFYMARKEVLEKYSPECGMPAISIGGCPDSWIKSGVCVLAIQDQACVLALYNQLLLWFDQLDSWEAALNAELEKEHDYDIRRFFLLTASFLHLDTGMTDPSFQYLFFAETSRNDNTGTTVMRDDRGYVPVEDMKKVRKVCEQERTIRSPYLSAIPYQGAAAFCYNLYIDGHFFGCAFVLKMNDTFSESEMFFASFFYDKLRRAFRRYVRFSSKTDSPELRFLKQLFGGDLPDRTDRNMFQEHDFATYRTLLLTKTGGHSLPEEYISCYLNAVMPGTVFLLHDSQIIRGVICLPAQDSDKQNILLRLREILDSTGYRAFVSDAFSDILKLNMYIKESTFLYAQHFPETDTLTFFEGYHLEYILYHGCSGLEKAMLYPESFRNLIAYDKRRNTDLVHTLDTYFQNGGSLTNTAEKLFIHRSTLLKRMDRIKTVMKTDLKDYRQNLLYQVCLRLSEIEERR